MGPQVLAVHSCNESQVLFLGHNSWFIAAASHLTVFTVPSMQNMESHLKGVYGARVSLGLQNVAHRCLVSEQVEGAGASHPRAVSSWSQDISRFTRSTQSMSRSEQWQRKSPGVKGHQAAEGRAGSSSGIHDDRWEIQNRAPLEP